MDDNARPHRILAVEELLESEDITRMDWPAYSPDLNPIEHVWDALGRCIAARLHHPENNQQLKQMLIEEWAILPQEMLHQLVLSMRRRADWKYTRIYYLQRRLRVLVERYRKDSSQMQYPFTPEGIAVTCTLTLTVIPADVLEIKRKTMK
ncbi:transposable element Tcb2 transposase [Trichonephila clavipes]|nr:transposable element Tcb2 transposase [Trichonephila clavipes]